MSSEENKLQIRKLSEVELQEVNWLWYPYIPYTIDRWTYQSVKNILVEESYTGLLVNHRTETHGRTVTPVPEDEQYRHENFFPVIIDREEWEQVQALLKANAKPYRGNTASHRYAGLLSCGDCGG